MLPDISIILPVYNGSKYVRKAIDSILLQSYSNYELIIINDGSTDNSLDVIKSYSDNRIRIINQANHGLAATLNIGISSANGNYIARQDQDDISKSDRLLRQINYMESNPDVALLGTRAEIWIGDEPTDNAHDHPTTNHELCFDLLFNNPFVHSSVMLRRDAVIELGGYSEDPTRQPPEDFELWSRIARKYKIANLPERLLIYREMPKSMSRTGENPFMDKLVTICAENTAFANNMESPDKDCIDLAALTHSAYHRLSMHPDMNKMSILLEQAARNIDPENNGELLSSNLEYRLANLRYQYMAFKSKVSWMRPFLSRAGKVLRKLGLR